MALYAHRQGKTQAVPFYGLSFVSAHSTPQSVTSLECLRDPFRVVTSPPCVTHGEGHGGRVSK